MRRGLQPLAVGSLVLVASVGVAPPGALAAFSECRSARETWSGNGEACVWALPDYEGQIRRLDPSERCVDMEVRSASNKSISGYRNFLRLFKGPGCDPNNRFAELGSGHSLPAVEAQSVEFFVECGTGC